VTDPEVTRYFMTIQEAVQLVIQAGAIGKSAETLVLDMGQPVRIADVAERLASHAPRPIDIVYTGLLFGEKLHEDLFGRHEVDTRPEHPLVSHVAVLPLDPMDALALDPWGADEETVAAMRTCAFGYGAPEGSRERDSAEGARL
jgi:FlaA1/EpsC-like NDP-sugar epimerase